MNGVDVSEIEVPSVNAGAGRIGVLLRFLFLARPSVVISVVFTVLFFGLVYIRYGGQIILTDSSISLPAAAMVIFSLASIASRYRLLFFGNAAERRKVLKRAGRIVLDWLPFPMLLFVYENLKGRIWIIAKNDFTPWLASTDISMFGFYPTVAMEKIYHPLLTDIMAFSYALYFVMPFIATFILYFQRRNREFQRAMFVIIICFYLGFVGYISLPGVIPKFFIKEAFLYPTIPSLFFHSLADKLYEKANAAEIWGAFPSLHIAVSTVGLILSFQIKGLVGKGRGLFWIFLPLTILLWISTVYLRYHWIIDIYAGWALAIFCCLVGAWIFNKLNARAQA